MSSFEPYLIPNLVLVFDQLWIVSNLVKCFNSFFSSIDHLLNLGLSSLICCDWGICWNKSHLIAEENLIGQ